MAWTAPRTWVAGEVVTAAIGNAQWRDNEKEIWRELAYVEFTADVTVNNVGEPGTQVVSAGAVTFDGSLAEIRFGCPGIAATASAINGGLDLRESTTVLGRMFDAGTTALAVSTYPVFLSRRFTPSAASHTYNVAAWNNTAANFTVLAGAGGSNTKYPGYIQVLQKGG